MLSTHQLVDNGDLTICIDNEALWVLRHYAYVDLITKMKQLRHQREHIKEPKPVFWKFEWSTSFISFYANDSNAFEYS